MATRQISRLRACSVHRRQQGATLAVSLILLTALTILGVTVLQSSGLHERMAANSQEKLAAFQAAESGAVNAIDLNSEFNPTDTHADQSSHIFASMYNGSVERATYSASRCWVQETKTGRQKDTAQDINSNRNFFDVLSLGETANTGARVAIHQGVYIQQFGAASNNGLVEYDQSDPTVATQGACMQQDASVF